MRLVMATAIAAAFTLTASSAYALQKGQGHGPKVKTTTSAPKAHPPQGGSKVHAQGPKTTPKTHAQGPKTTPKTHAQGPKTKTKTKTVTTVAGSKKTNTTSAGSVATTGKRTTTTTTTTTGTTLTPVQQKLQRNTNLASKLAGRLPAGTDLMTAAEGFRNLGQFVAAVNVSNNLNIPFADLKTAMVVEGMSLGQAIKSERPTADTTTEVRRAESDATRLIASIEDDSTTTKKKSSSKAAKKNTKGQR